ncbi:MAG: flagellar biosynthesis regulatory protein FlaF [Deltaproteobacteria bacterium]|nr:MAG: flagellar biosynthesis regulatory protein FlaF [Deltaproteobacteria bacterium]RPJ16959.1 MAG: flagellar biosynthesis regulatory protein FlaF [Deltaproteobacteria bacterium]
MYQAALKAYDSVNKATMSGRDVEAEVLTKAALKLKACQNTWAENGQSINLEAALKYNQRIWTIFQAEIEKPDNPLPDALKADLLKLSIFVDKRTLETLAYPMPEKLTILININYNIAAGLRMRPSAALPTSAAA